MLIQSRRKTYLNCHIEFEPSPKIPLKSRATERFASFVARVRERKIDGARPLFYDHAERPDAQNTKRAGKQHRVAVANLRFLEDPSCRRESSRLGPPELCILRREASRLCLEELTMPPEIRRIVRVYFARAQRVVTDLARDADFWARLLMLFETKAGNRYAALARTTNQPVGALGAVFGEQIAVGSRPGAFAAGIHGVACVNPAAFGGRGCGTRSRRRTTAGSRAAVVAGSTGTVGRVRLVDVNLFSLLGRKVRLDFRRVSVRADDLRRKK